MKLNREQVRDELKRLKKMNVSQFRIELNIMHSRAYDLAAKHYQEAMDIIIPAKQKAAVIEKAIEIRKLWDGIREVTIEGTDTNE